MMQTDTDNKKKACVKMFILKWNLVIFSEHLFQMRQKRDQFTLKQSIDTSWYEGSLDACSTVTGKSY